MRKKFWRAAGRRLLREQRLLDTLDALLIDAKEDQVAAELRDAGALLERRDGLRQRCAALAGDGVPVRIALVGDFSAGKSSFINSLLQDDGLCPEHDDPTTSWVTTFSYAASEKIVMDEEGGRSLRLTRAGYHEKVQQRAGAGASVRPLRFGFFLPHPLLKGVELLDTPGFNNPRNASDSEVTKGIMEGCDAFLYLVDATNGTIAESGLQRLQQIRQRAGEAPIYLLLSKSDRKAPAALVRIKDELRRSHTELFKSRVYCWSSLSDNVRLDIDGHAAVTGLFDEMRNFKAFEAVRETLLALRRHQDMQRRYEIELRQRLVGLATTHARLAVNAESKLQTVDELLRRLKAEMRSDYMSCVSRAASRHLAVEKIDGTGWIFRDARIVYDEAGFSTAITSLRTAVAMRERMLAEISRHYKSDMEQLRNEVEWRCRAASEDAAKLALNIMDRFKSKQVEIKYDTDVQAQTALDKILPVLSAELGAAMWREWPDWLSSLLDCLRDDYTAPAVRASRALAEGIGEALEAFHALPVDPATFNVKEYYAKL